MNWRNVLRLISADVKSYRLVRGKRFRRFRENKLVTYALYIGSCIFGAAIGWFIGNFYNGLVDPQLKELLLQGAVNLFISLPTLALLYGVVFTQMGQIQRIGVKVSIQPLYWFPITWEEHTLASILAKLLGAPLIITSFIGSAVAVASVFLRLAPLAVFTILALLASVFLASATTEILKILQVRISGAVTKVAGRATIWIRLLGSILFFIVLYIFYFSLYYNVSPLTLLEVVAGGQRVLWFIPYVWPGIALSSFASGLGIETVIFSLAMFTFICLLFLAAVHLNIRFGLYEAPSITVSRGAYIPKAGLLGRLGFSPLEAAVMRKDFKALTRRRELMYIFIFPVFSVIVGLVSFGASIADVGQGPMPSWFRILMFLWLAVLPGTVTAMALGSTIVGMEGESVWYIYSSPIAARSLVQAKYAFVMFFSMALMAVCFVVGGLFAPPLAQVVAVSFIEAMLLIISLSMVSLCFGIKGADFREFPRPRMIRTKYSVINLVVCILLALAIISPIIPYALKLIFEAREAGLAVPIWVVTSDFISEAHLYAALPISGVIASVITYVFYRIALKNAENFLITAEG